MTEFSKTLLEKHYCRPGETVEQAFMRACECFSSNTEHADRLYKYLKDEWFMFSSPILSNAVLPGEKVKGLPISCFLTYVDDSIKGLCDHTTEERILSVKGGGVGGHWSDVRGISEITPGVNGFLHTVDADMVAYRQGKTRRGSYAAYLNIDHPEIIEFIKMRVPTGDLNRKNLNLHHGVNITDDFIDAVDADSEWCLIDPHSLEITDRVRARELWEEILTTRFRTGEPYINYIDEANDKLPQYMKDKGLRINGSNLCNEIHLPTSEDRTAVCCLSSVNLATYDEWKDNTDFIGDLIEMLDNVLEFFIDNAPSELHKAAYSAIMERSLGLGAMGFSDYLQSHMIPWESSMAISINRGMFKNIKDKATTKTKELAIERGEAPDAEGYGVRNTHLLAIAPNANSSIILGVSASIEPRVSNCYTHKTRVGSYLVKNPELEEYFFCSLETADMDMDKVWQSIMDNNGSVQHLEWMPKEDREVFKTAAELDQRWLVDMARSRQEFICQGQSVNLFFPTGADKAYVNTTHRRAFSQGGIGYPLKGLYYLRTESAGKVEKVNVEVKRDKLQDGVQGGLDECIACEG
jgi:ribonucleoside-diphosphate reductase alpha chain